MTTPLPFRPPSTDVTVAQDSAFPTFPIPKARSATPTALLESHSLFPPTRSDVPLQPELDSKQNEKTRINDAGSMLKRMDSIAPGPFDVKDNHEGSNSASGHRKSPSMGSSTDLVRPTSSGTVKTHALKPSTSSSVYTRKRSTSTVSGTSRYDWNAEGIPSVPSVSREENVRPPGEQVNTQNDQQNVFDFGPLGQISRSQTFPQNEQFPSQHVQNSTERRPSEPSPYSHKPRPSVVAAMQPLDSIGSSSSFRPSRSIRGRQASLGVNKVAQRTGESINSRDDTRLQDAPPVPAVLSKAPQESESPYHTPHESTSSNGSYSSGARSGSSRSSPPLQESPQQRLQDVPEDDSNRNMFNDFQFGVDNRTPSDDPVTYQEHRRLVPEVYVPQHPSRPPSESARPTIPDIQPQVPPSMMTTPPMPSPDEYLVSSFDSSARSNNLHISPVPPRTPTPVSPGRPSHRPRPADKGPCRGCGELIIGKSVSSADGRLSGKYHKGCFVCKTCNNPFQTADFYVIRNHPYCARHYHELNNSLCSGCDRGIEGQYLETETRRKFHSYCFTCQDCHRILREDYFEWNGRTLCEQHAFKAAQQPSSALGIGGGRRYPERRTTKLMMMM